MKVTTDFLNSARAAMAIGCLDPKNASEGTKQFPRGNSDDKKIKIRSNESLNEWFFRVIGEQDPENSIRHCSIEKNFAFFGSVVWKDETLIYCNFQGLITRDCSLTDFYKEQQEIVSQSRARTQNETQAQPESPTHDQPKAKQLAHYYRFDLDPSKPGPLFKEPQPHIHCVPDGAPRFPITLNQDEYCLISFLEFIYRNHFYEKWLDWVKAVSIKSITEEELVSLINAFNTGIAQKRIGVVEPLLKKLTTTLRQQKRDQVCRQLALPDLCAATVY